MTEHRKVGEFQVVGTRPVRPDGVDKVTGKAIYGPDFVAPGMIHGAILRSPHAHARIRSIDTSKAAALAGVKAVMTGRDFPSQSAHEVSLGETAANIEDIMHNCMAFDKVLYEGHAVAAVAATTRAIAEAALALIEVDYEPLPHVMDPEAACRGDAPILHPKASEQGSDKTSAETGNITAQSKFENGDVAQALKNAVHVTEGRYRTEPVHQGYIEPHACVASWNSDGQGQIWCSSQGAFMVRSLVAGILKVPISNIRVMPLEIGGGFGGKTTIYLEPVAMLLSRKAGRPVRLAMSRQEVFRASGPAPGCVIDIRMGTDADGNLVGMDADFLYNAGAYPGGGAGAGTMVALGMYRLPSYSVSARDVVTNMPSVAAYRAPAAPQITFAIESCMDDLARQIGMDAIELRMKNAVRPGDPTGLGTNFGEIGFVECLEAAEKHAHRSAPLGKNQGRGIAAGYWFNVGGASTASVSIAEDGSVAVVTGNPDIGGSRASMAMMAAEVLGIDISKVRPIVGDTASVGYSFLTGGSRVTFATGMAVTQSAEQARDELCKRAALLWEIPPEAVEWRDGMAHPAGDNAGKFDPMSLADIAAKSGRTGGPITGKASINAQGAGPGYATHICDVEVDEETGHVAVLRYTAIQDVGKAIHPAYVEGQLQGGAVQGIGWALNEEYIYDKNGRLDNPGFLDYRVPVASDLPMIETILVEVPNPRHPFGAKGVGEAPIVPPMAAVANAIEDATGVRLPDLPMSPPRVRAALDSAKG